VDFPQRSGKATILKLRLPLLLILSYFTDIFSMGPQFV
jgi:hypothetical protein